MTAQLTNVEILATIAKIMADQIDSPQPLELTEETNVRGLFFGEKSQGQGGFLNGEPTGLDSLDLIEVIMAIEDHFGIEIPDDVEAAKTGKDFVELVRSRVHG